MSKVYRVEWVPGSDTLKGVCHCGATVRAVDPVQVWEWLLTHIHNGGVPCPG
jgi:hypothetical protein